MQARLAPGAVALGLIVAGCATPGVLKRGPNAPTMARPSEANPLPTYAAPDPHIQSQHNPSAPP